MAQQVGAELSDVYLMWAETLEQVEARIRKMRQLIQACGREKLVRYGVRVNIILLKGVLKPLLIFSYESDISDEQMRAHFINLIQTAPNIATPKRFTASITSAIFDAIVNLIDSARNVNKARKVITQKQAKPDFWERALKTLKATIKTLKSTAMFILPKRVSQAPTAISKI